MKLVSGLLICFIVGSFSITCTDGCEEEDQLHEAYEWTMHDADEHDVETCSPFCGCSCCQSLSIESPFSDVQEFKAYQPQTERIFQKAPDSPGQQVWQPPRC